MGPVRLTMLKERKKGNKLKSGLAFAAQGRFIASGRNYQILEAEQLNMTTRQINSMKRTRMAEAKNVPTQSERADKEKAYSPHVVIYYGRLHAVLVENECSFRLWWGTCTDWA